MRNAMYGIRFTTHADDDFFPDDLDVLVEAAPKKPSLIGIGEA